MKNNVKFIITILILLAITLVILKLIQKPEPIINPFIQGGKQNQTTALGEEVIVDEEYFEARYPVIQGDSTIARRSREYIQSLLTEIQTDAMNHIPELRIEFPDSFQDMKYAVYITAEKYTDSKLDTVVLNNYVYTGGANGNSFYTTFTQNNKGEIIELSSLVPEEFRDTFVRAVQTQLTDNVFFGTDAVYVFKDAVDELTFDQLTRFAVDGDDMLIFFDKYEVSAGAAGLIKVYIENYKKLFQESEQELFSLNTEICFTLHEESYGTATDEVLKLIRIDEQNISGEKQGTSQGAYNAGYFGTISGTLVENIIEAIYSYTVDGSEQRQEERYIIRDGKLFAEIYQLSDDFENGILVIDREAKVRDKEYTMVDC